MFSDEIVVTLHALLKVYGFGHYSQLLPRALSQAAHRLGARAVLPRFRGSAARRLLDGREPRGDRTLPEPPAHQANRLQRPQRRFGLRPMAQGVRAHARRVHLDRRERRLRRSGVPRTLRGGARCRSRVRTGPHAEPHGRLGGTAVRESPPCGTSRTPHGRTTLRAEAPAAPQRTLQRQHGRLPPFGTACGRGIRRIPLRRRLVFLDARRIAGPRVHRLRTAQRLPPPRRGHDDAGRTDGRTLRRGVADPACHLFADADGGTGTLGARRQAALPAAQSPPAVRTERSLRTAVEPLVRNLPMRPVAQSVVSNLRGAARQHVFFM